MPRIEEKYLNELREAGLHVSHPIEAFLAGVWVCKPTSTPGNHIPGYSGGGYISLGDAQQCPDIDAPMLKFFFANGSWQVHGQDCAGGLGPADFIDEWSTPEEAVKDILDFYFGDPTRMERKAAEKAKIQARREARMKDDSVKRGLKETT